MSKPLNKESLQQILGRLNTGPTHNKTITYHFPMPTVEDVLAVAEEEKFEREQRQAIKDVELINRCVGTESLDNVVDELTRNIIKQDTTESTTTTTPTPKPDDLPSDNIASPGADVFASMLTQLSKLPSQRPAHSSVMQSALYDEIPDLKAHTFNSDDSSEEYGDCIQNMYTPSNTKRKKHVIKELSDDIENLSMEISDLTTMVARYRDVQNCMAKDILAIRSQLQRAFIKIESIDARTESMHKLLTTMSDLLIEVVQHKV